MSRLVTTISLAALVLCAAIALAVPTTSSADDLFGYDHDYQGKMENGDILYFGFDYKKSGNKAKMSKFSVIAPFNCANSTTVNLLAIRFNGKLAVKDGKLNVKNKKVKFRIFSTTTRVNGRLTMSAKFKGKKAKGTFQLSTKSSGALCTFGVLNWKAKRGATVTLPTP